jgi:hypothetical protein
MVLHAFGGFLELQFCPWEQLNLWVFLPSTTPHKKNTQSSNSMSGLEEFGFVRSVVRIPHFVWNLCHKCTMNRSPCCTDKPGTTMPQGGELVIWRALLTGVTVPRLPREP